MDFENDGYSLKTEHPRRYDRCPKLWFSQFSFVHSPTFTAVKEKSSLRQLMLLNVCTLSLFTAHTQWSKVTKHKLATKSASQERSVWVNQRVGDYMQREPCGKGDNLFISTAVWINTLQLNHRALRSLSAPKPRVNYTPRAATVKAVSSPEAIQTMAAHYQLNIQCAIWMLNIAVTI